MKKLILAAALFAATLGLNSKAQAAYSQAPSWMPMTMLSVTFDATAGALAVEDQAVKLQGTNPQLYTNTTNNGMTPGAMNPMPAGNANFDPTKPLGSGPGHRLQPSPRLG
jgi:hypothetical protein